MQQNLRLSWCASAYVQTWGGAGCSRVPCGLSTLQTAALIATASRSPARTARDPKHGLPLSSPSRQPLGATCTWVSQKHLKLSVLTTGFSILSAPNKLFFTSEFFTSVNM